MRWTRPPAARRDWRDSATEARMPQSCWTRRYALPKKIPTRAPTLAANAPGSALVAPVQRSVDVHQNPAAPTSMADRPSSEPSAPISGIVGPASGLAAPTNAVAVPRSGFVFTTYFVAAGPSDV